MIKREGFEKIIHHFENNVITTFVKRIYFKAQKDVAKYIEDEKKIANITGEFTKNTAASAVIVQLIRQKMTENSQ